MSALARVDTSIEQQGFVAGLQARARDHGDDVAIRFLTTGDVDGPTETWTYAELDERASRVAAELRRRHLDQVPVLLVYSPGLDFLAAFIGCLYARAIAVPVYPPNPADLERAIKRIQAIADDSGCQVVLTTDVIEQLAGSLGSMLGELANLHWLATDTLTDDIVLDTPLPVEPEHVAFLQYTSGSTGTPKGVVIRHEQLGFHLDAIYRKCPMSQHMVTWLPAYHDMGLIGTLLVPLSRGIPIAQMEPHAFLMKPARWMKAISHFKADVTAGPNFGYHLAAKKTTPQELAELDLSSMKFAVCGAEPISPLMLEEFFAVFERCGFARSALMPAYGMAEATLMVTGTEADQAPTVVSFGRRELELGQAVVAPDGTSLVGCGITVADQEVGILDPDTMALLADGRVGEIVVRGQSVAREYWKRPESAYEVFGCRIDGTEGRFLRTGDLGFIHDGELYVSGRMKDLLIIRGRNFAAADIEMAVESELGVALGLRPGRVIAISVPGAEGEEPVILAELRDDNADIEAELMAKQVSDLVARHFGITPAVVVFLAKAAVPLTSSGKVQRRQARADFLAGDLREVARVGNHTDAGTEITSEELYGPLAVVHERLDNRTTEYLFDIEHDMPWARLDEPGMYIPTPLLELFGIDVVTLAGNREAYETLQWAMALSICRTFEILEWGIIQFARSEVSRLGNTRSIDRLCVEEEKHIQLFRRLAAHLAQQRPDLMAEFDAAFADSFRYLRSLFTDGTPAELHLKIWLTTLFFEPATLHLADELTDTDEPVQPAWVIAHQLHAQEELQHIATAGAYSSQLRMDDETRDRVTTEFVADFARGFQHTHGVAAPLELMRRRWPELQIAPQPDAIPAPFLEEVAYNNHFKPLRRAIPNIEERITAAAPVKTSLPRPDVVFVLSSERSGSTLLRVMLSAHPTLFSPPEMNLLGYQTMANRRTELPDVQQSGLPVALAELDGFDRESAQAKIAQLEAQNAPTADVFALLLDALGEQILVDKSPIYSRSIDALREAELLFGDRARYVFLTRHPHSVIESYGRIGLQRLVADQIGDDANAIDIGEMGWTLSNRTILEFLSEVDPARHTTVAFEELVNHPRTESARLLTFLGLDYNERVVQPYRHGEMTGRTGEEHAVGDPNFDNHAGIDPSLADAWRAVDLGRPLGNEATRVAEVLGYELAAPAPDVAAPSSVVVSAASTEQVRSVVVEVLAAAAEMHPSEFDDETAFDDLGLDSLHLVQLTNALEAQLGHVLPAMTMYDYPTVGTLAAHLAVLGSASAASGGPATVVDNPPASERSARRIPDEPPPTDLTAEVWLPDSVQAAAVHVQTRNDDVFLTGGTGFLGAYILEDLLEQTTGRVHCLVRAEDEAAGRGRILDNLAFYEIDLTPDAAARIIAVPGDLGTERFGLAPAEFDRLADAIGALYHNGALLKFGQSYEQLKAPNVDGTRTVLELATRTEAARPVHYVSSMAVFNTSEHWDGQVAEDTSIDKWAGLRLGYSQTKWVGEQLVRLAGERGVPVNVCRSAGIGGHSETGASNSTDVIWRLLSGCVQMGAVPDIELDVDFATVDYVAGAFVAVSLHGEPGGIYHLNNPDPLPFTRLIHWMGFQGFELDILPYDDWADRLKIEARMADHPLASLVPFFTLPTAPDGYTQFEVRGHRPSIGNDASVARLGELGLHCPKLDNRLLTVWFDRLAADGFLVVP